MRRIAFHTRMKRATVLVCSYMAMSAMADGLPPMQTQAGVQYTCGGIGEDESKAFLAARKTFPLSLLFATKAGAYLADVKIALRHAGGDEVFNVLAEGPMCLIKLPAGAYTLTANSEGLTQQRSFKINGKPAYVDIRF